MTADIREGMADIAATVVKVDVAKRRSSNLAAAQADIAEQEDEHPPKVRPRRPAYVIAARSPADLVLRLQPGVSSPNSTPRLRAEGQVAGYRGQLLTQC